MEWSSVPYSHYSLDFENAYLLTVSKPFRRLKYPLLTFYIKRGTIYLSLNKALDFILMPANNPQC